MTQINIKRFFKNWGSPLGHALFFIVVTSAVASGFVQAAEINATAKLSWTVPATRENGSVLKSTDIASYKVRWGTSPGKTIGTIPVATGTSYDWAAPLTIGTDGTVTAYFSVAAIDADGRESKRSPEASKTFTLLDDSPPSPPVITVVVTCTAPAGFKCEVAP